VFKSVYVILCHVQVSSGYVRLVQVISFWDMFCQVMSGYFSLMKVNSDYVMSEKIRSGYVRLIHVMRR
jgi:Ni,Fe-hydrogenase I cytochrome b subunit